MVLQIRNGNLTFECADKWLQILILRCLLKYFLHNDGPMAQFKYLNEMNSLINMDGPLTKGPLARWQKKALESSSNSSNDTINSSKHMSSFTALANKITPSKRATGSDVVRVNKKTPSKTPSKSKSPSRSTTPTPNDGAKTPGGGDRFIPSRSASNFELAHYKLNTEEIPVDSPTQKEYQRVMGENLHGNDINKQRILSYQKKAPAAPEGFQNPMKVLYVHTKTPASVKSSSRYIPQAPDRILDAPDIVDDYYLNLIDWSPNNILAAALGSTVYLWNAGN